MPEASKYLRILMLYTQSTCMVISGQHPFCQHTRSTPERLPSPGAECRSRPSWNGPWPPCTPPPGCACWWRSRRPPGSRCLATVWGITCKSIGKIRKDQTKSAPDLTCKSTGKMLTISNKGSDKNHFWPNLQINQKKWWPYPKKVATKLAPDLSTVVIFIKVQLLFLISVSVCACMCACVYAGF